jgi:hypothetical protein
MPQRAPDALTAQRKVQQRTVSTSEMNRVLPKRTASSTWFWNRGSWAVTTSRGLDLSWYGSDINHVVNDAIRLPYTRHPDTPEAWGNGYTHGTTQEEGTVAIGLARTLDRWCWSQWVAEVAGSIMKGTFSVKFSSTMAFCMDRESDGRPSAFHLHTQPNGGTASTSIKPPRLGTRVIHRHAPQHVALRAQQLQDVKVVQTTDIQPLRGDTGAHVLWRESSQP